MGGRLGGTVYGVVAIIANNGETCSFQSFYQILAFHFLAPFYT